MVALFNMAAPISRCFLFNLRLKNVSICSASERSVFNRLVNQRQLFTSTSRHSAVELKSRSSGAVQETRERWRLMSAVCVERSAVISRDLNEIEREYARLQEKLELERSVLSDHELRHLDDLAIAKKKKQEDEGEGDVVRTTAVESEDAWEEELKRFKPASRITEADEKNDVRSLDRQLDRRLVLCVKQPLGSTAPWVLPMSAWADGESMRDAAERTLATLCGSDLKTLFLGNTPCGYYKYKYPQELQNSSKYTGAKIFFFKAQYISGQVSLQDVRVKEGKKTTTNKSDHNERITDFMWLNKEELKTHLTPAYNYRIQRFILDL